MGVICRLLQNPVVDDRGNRKASRVLQIKEKLTRQQATIFMCALLPLSLYWMRQNAYEAFLIIHILFSIVVLATMYL